MNSDTDTKLTGKLVGCILSVAIVLAHWCWG